MWSRGLIKRVHYLSLLPTRLLLLANEASITDWSNDGNIGHLSPDESRWTRWPRWPRRPRRPRWWKWTRCNKKIKITTVATLIIFLLMNEASTSCTEASKELSIWADQWNRQLPSGFRFSFWSRRLIAELITIQDCARQRFWNQSLVEPEGGDQLVQGAKIHYIW